MNRALKVARLQMNKPDVTFIVPLTILLMVAVISAIIAIAIQRAGVDPSNPEYVTGARWNQGMVWSLPGFLVYFGVQAVATTFPFSLALGITRRAFVAGTGLGYLVQSAYISLVMLVLLGLELATGHWFFDIYVLDVYWFGSGDPWQLFVTAFLGAFTALSIGGMFGAVWVRFGARGPAMLGVVLALVLALGFLAIVPQIGEIVASLTGAKVAAGAVGVALLALLGTWLSMRRTAVR